MNNKRIDLTQFEGHTSDWSIEEGPLPTLFITDNDGVIATMEMDAEERYVADSLLISKAPDLLAELKRCYQKIDRLSSAMKGHLICPECTNVMKYDGDPEWDGVVVCDCESNIYASE